MPVTGVLLVLDSTVLEPDLHLLLGQPERGGDLDASEAGQVLAGGELVLETQQLGAGERRSQAFHRHGALWRLDAAAAILCLRIRYC